MIELPALLSRLPLGADGIHSAAIQGSGQDDEMRLREEIAARDWGDHLAEISRHHSIPVMDCEVDRFLAAIPQGGVVVDVGGCWGWHWRRLAETRPDVRVVVVDLIRGNLAHARALLGEEIGRRVFLVHGDATRLDFPDGCFDGYWTVQTLQHVPAFDAAIAEAVRVLKAGGAFALYSLHDTPLVRAVYRLFGKPWHVAGEIPGAFHLERLSDRQAEMVARRFGARPERRFTELLFSPDLKAVASGRQGSALGRLDAALSGSGCWRGLTARQQSLHVRKPG